MSNNVQAFQTPIGWCAIAGHGEVVRAVSVGHRRAENAARSIEKVLGPDIRESTWNRPLAERITAALEGEPDEFLDVEIDLSHLTPFARRVAAACRKIRWGQTPKLRKFGHRGGVSGRGPRGRACDGHEPHGTVGALPPRCGERRAFGRLLGAARN